MAKPEQETVTEGHCQERPGPLQENSGRIRRRHAAERRLSGVGGAIGELDELLGMIGKARNDMEKEKKAVAAAQEEREASKVRIGKTLVARSLTRKSSDSEEDTEGDDQDTNGDGEGPGNARKKRRTSVVRAGGAFEAELERFGVALRDADMARLAIDKERLVVERERVEKERQDRKKERDLRREERIAQQQLELEKFKMMMDAFMHTKK